MSIDVELVKALGTRFIERKDVKAVQGEENPFDHQVKGWQPIKQPFTMQDFEDHLAGNRTFGHYMLSTEGNCKLFAFDIDLDKEGSYWTADTEPGETIECNPREAWLAGDSHPAHLCLTTQLRAMAEGLAVRTNRILGIPVAIAYTGRKGLHVYGFTGSKPASVVRQLAVGILDDFGCFDAVKGDVFYKHRTEYRNLTIEVFPKQDSIDGKQFGNLMALPLGIHKETGQRKFFLTTNAPNDKFVEMDPMKVLDGDLPWE